MRTLLVLVSALRAANAALQRPPLSSRRDALGVGIAAVAAPFVLSPAAVHPTPPRPVLTRPVLTPPASAGETNLVTKDKAPWWSPREDFLVGPEKNAISDYELVPSQRAPPTKIDINNAKVTDYMPLRGMYPHAAGVIASHGPYQSVDDLFRIPEASLMLVTW
tara:strand:+ start:1165 stop:1653 length:489 start_codon:yes stop_codon:yes gene_type:complete